jgi:hypothetical protein
MSYCNACSPYLGGERLGKHSRMRAGAVWVEGLSFPQMPACLPIGIRGHGARRGRGAPFGLRTPSEASTITNPSLCRHFTAVRYFRLPAGRGGSQRRRTIPQSRTGLLDSWGNRELKQ